MIGTGRCKHGERSGKFTKKRFQAIPNVTDPARNDVTHSRLGAAVVLVRSADCSIQYLSSGRITQNLGRLDTMCSCRRWFGLTGRHRTPVEVNHKPV